MLRYGAQGARDYERRTLELVFGVQQAKSLLLQRRRRIVVVSSMAMTCGFMPRSRMDTAAALPHPSKMSVCRPTYIWGEPCHMAAISPRSSATARRSGGADTPSDSPRTRSRSKVVFPAPGGPGGYPGYSTSQGASPAMGASAALIDPGAGQGIGGGIGQGQLTIPEGFDRPVNAALSYTPFEPMKIQDMDEFLVRLPRMPLVLQPPTSRQYAEAPAIRRLLEFLS